MLFTFTVSPEKNPHPKSGIGDAADSLALRILRSPPPDEVYPDLQRTATSRFPGSDVTAFCSPSATILAAGRKPSGYSRCVAAPDGSRRTAYQLRSRVPRVDEQQFCHGILMQVVRIICLGCPASRTTVDTPCRRHISQRITPLACGDSARQRT